MSYDMVEENVPPLQTRIGDYAVHGSNNSSLILGRDRAKFGPATVDDGLGTIDDPGMGRATGTAHLVVGRQNKSGDPDFSKDNAFLYLSMKTKLDDNLNISTSGDVKVPKDNGVSAAILKSDNLRVVYRKNAMVVIEGSSNFLFLDKDSAVISMNNGSNYIKLEKGKTTLKIGSSAEIVIDGDGKVVSVDVDKSGKIELSKGAVNHLLQSEAFLQKFDSHIHPTGTGPSGAPVVPLTPLKDQLSSTGVINKPEIAIP